MVDAAIGMCDRLGSMVLVDNVAVISVAWLACTTQPIYRHIQTHID